MPGYMSASERTSSRVRVVCLAFLVATFACSPPQRHAVLDFVFDGVPPYKTPQERSFEAMEAAQKEAEEAARVPDRRKRAIRKLARFTHGPFAADECTRCHDLTTASGFRGLSGGAGGTRAASDLAEAGRLRMPVNELCVHCHSDFTDEAPGNEDLWLHGPVASGWCVLCHQPHSSQYPSLLTHDPTARLCSRCHVREDLVETAEHIPMQGEEGYPARLKTEPIEEEGQGVEASNTSLRQVVRDCTGCHDPHMGSNRLLLRPRDQREHRPEPSNATAVFDTRQGEDR